MLGRTDASGSVVVGWNSSSKQKQYGPIDSGIGEKFRGPYVTYFGAASDEATRL